MQLAVDGSGTRWATISRTLSGDGTLAFRDGRLTSPALVNGLATFLQLPDLTEINFREFRGKARIVAGRAEIDSSLSGRQLKLFPRGSLGLDGSLNLTMDTRLSPELTARLNRRGQVTRYLLDARGVGPAAAVGQRYPAGATFRARPQGGAGPGDAGAAAGTAARPRQVAGSPAASPIRRAGVWGGGSGDSTGPVRSGTAVATARTGQPGSKIARRDAAAGFGPLTHRDRSNDK
jgi:hypothetical protein